MPKSSYQKRLDSESGPGLVGHAPVRLKPTTATFLLKLGTAISADVAGVNDGLFSQEDAVWKDNGSGYDEASVMLNKITISIETYRALAKHRMGNIAAYQPAEFHDAVADIFVDDEVLERLNRMHPDPDVAIRKLLGFTG